MNLFQSTEFHVNSGNPNPCISSLIVWKTICGHVSFVMSPGTQPPGHQTWSLHSRAEVGNSFPFGPVAQGCEPNWVENATGQVSFPGGPDIEKKMESRPSSLNIKGRFDPPAHLKEGAKPL